MPKNYQQVTEFRSYYLPIEFPVILLSGDRWHISDISNYPLHFHNCLEIGVCLKGSGILKFDKKDYSFKAGDITCIPKNVPHTTYSTLGTQSLWTYIFFDTDELFRGISHDSTMLLELSINNPNSFQYIMSEAEYPKVKSIAMACVEELLTQSQYYKYSVTALLFALCIEVCRINRNNHSDLIKSNTQVREIIAPNSALAILPALDYIDKYFSSQITVKELAHMCHLSESHFRRTFQTSMNARPLDFINNTRIHKACVLLKTSQESILYISEQVGFQSISSFNRCFSKIMGSSPREWREQMLFSDEKPMRGVIVKYNGWL